MDYKNKYLKYKSKYLSLKKYSAGFLPDWFILYMNEAKKIQDIALHIDRANNNFLITGSNAIIFYIYEILTHHIDLMNNDDKDYLLSLIVRFQKPDDLDIKYKDTGMKLFHDAIETITDNYRRMNPPPPPKPLVMGKFNLSLVIPSDSRLEDIEKCPIYIEIDAFRCCTPSIGDDAMFKKLSYKESIFSKVDFDRLKIDHIHYSNIYGANILGIHDLFTLYKTHETESDKIKIDILDFIICLINDFPDIKNKFYGIL